MRITLANPTKLSDINSLVDCDSVLETLYFRLSRVIYICATILVYRSACQLVKASNKVYFLKSQTLVTASKQINAEKETATYFITCMIAQE